MDNSQSIIYALFFITMTIAIVAGIYSSTRKRLGERVAKLLFPYQFIKGAAYFGLLLLAGFMLDSRNLNGVVILLLVMISSVILSMRFNRLRYPERGIIYDLSHRNQEGKVEFVVFTILGTFNVLISLVFLALHHEASSVSTSILFSLALGLAFLMLARCVAIRKKRGKTLLTKTHFFDGLENVELADIKRLVWGQDWDGKTILILKRDGPFSAFRHLKVIVPTRLRRSIQGYVENAIHA